MSHSDINDNEIRVISSCGSRRHSGRRKRRPSVWLCIAAALLLIAATALLFFTSVDSADGDSADARPIQASATTTTEAEDTPLKAPYTERKDTVVNDVELSILTPVNATPVLETGNDVTADSSAVLIAQAADIRADNGKIVGAFVKKGELVSKGESKAGFCSIINGKITIGVADATPMFEQALTSDGYFFRQYPLVVAGLVVENKPLGKSIRKALAESDSKICVIISNNRVSFHDFSQALADAGFRNAIYLVGGNSYGSYMTGNGERMTIGKPWDENTESVNYIVWR